MALLMLQRQGFPYRSLSNPLSPRLFYSSAITTPLVDPESFQVSQQDTYNLLVLRREITLNKHGYCM